MRRAAALALALLSWLLLPAPGAAATAPLQVLEGRIVRALAVHPEEPARILVGTKGEAAGSALVLQSLDRGRSWSPLNGGRPLSPEASDVQSLAFLPDGEILAGTWKHGLYRSRDDGGRFDRVQSFPVPDVRDLLVLPGRAPRLFAATGTAGVARSDDGGKSWHLLGPDGGYIWSLSVSRPSRAALYATSPNAGVYGSIDGGDTWYRLFQDEGAYAVDATDLGSDSFIVAGETGLHFSPDGKAWLRVPGLPELKPSSLLGASNGPLLVGSWGGGVLPIGADGAPGEHLLPGVPVVHLARAGADLLVGTWGQGLYVFPGWYAPQ